MTNLSDMDTTVRPGDLRGFTPINGVQVSWYDMDTTEEWVFIGFFDNVEGIAVVHAQARPIGYDSAEWSEFNSLIVLTMAEAVAAVDELAIANEREHRAWLGQAA